MATLSFSFDTGSVSLSRIVDAVATVHGYNAEIGDPENPSESIPNPQTKAEFAEEVLKNIIIQIVRDAETRTAREAAVASVQDITLSRTSEAR